MKAHQSLTKGSSGKNISAEVIAQMKNIGSSSKENYQPQISQPQDLKQDLKKETVRKSKVIEGDFSRIACSYVLEGDRLRKQEAYEDTLAKQKKKTQIKTNADKENTKVDPAARKELIKLEYLEKMGFLRPEEQELLANLRKDTAQLPQKYVEQAPDRAERALHPQNKNKTQEYDHLYQQIPFYSPKGSDPKAISQFFSPNKLGAGQYHYQHSYGYAPHHY